MKEKIGILLALVVLVIYWYRVGRPKENKKKREKQMMAEYPDVIAKLTVLTGAGLTLPQAWLRISEDYEKNGLSLAGKEMCVTARQIQNGVSPSQAFGEFGRRTGIHAYMKLGNLLEQNMKKGTKGLNEMLKTEAWQAFEERKHQVRRTGEEISTALMLPMFMMFGVVLVVILVPALMTFSLT